MGRERTPLKREHKKDSVVINIADIFRNPDIQSDVIKNLKKLKK